MTNIPIRLYRVWMMTVVLSPTLLVGCGDNGHGRVLSGKTRPDSNHAATVFGEKPSENGADDREDDGENALVTGETQFASADDISMRQTNVSSSRGVDVLSLTDNMSGQFSTVSAPERERTVEEGNIYKVLGKGKILNLNSLRGLQVIDFSDVANPTIIGRLSLVGSPVELYISDSKAVILLTDWTGYFGSGEDNRITKRTGSAVVLADLSDLTRPKILDQAYVPGSITTSRLTRAGAQVALYLVANRMDSSNTSTLVKSFDVSADSLRPVTTLDLGGAVLDIQATAEALLVARTVTIDSVNRSRVTIIDISDPTGKMTEGDEVATAGMVQSKFNMDLYQGVLRVVSGSPGGSTSSNHLQTFDAKDVFQLTEIDHCEFGEGEQLFATLFLGHKAFFVTYFRRDPFHAFSIDGEGKCSEQNAFIVSGWNDYFRAVRDDSRLVGIGADDQGNNRTVAVSLYDVTNLTNPNPLLARAEVALDNSWSQARWDDKAFSVLENAVLPEAANGETGLILLPFNGYSNQESRSVAAVQIFTFSQTTITRRGIMDHGTTVRRSFAADDQTIANLSNSELRLFDPTDPNSPKELSRLALTTNYTQLLIFGDYAVRVKRADQGYSWWGFNGAQSSSVAEIVPRFSNPDMAAPLQRIEIPSGAYLIKSGKYLVSVNMVPVRWTSDEGGIYDTTIDVYDLRDPLAPQKTGTIQTDRLRPSFVSDTNYLWTMTDAFIMDTGAFRRYANLSNYQNPSSYVLDGAVVFTRYEPRKKRLGTGENCYQYGPSNRVCDSSGTCEPSFWYIGSRTCTSLNQGPRDCTGQIMRCDNYGNKSCCAMVDPTSISLTESCSTSDSYRYWNSYSLYVLDLTGPEPKLNEPIALPEDYEGRSFLASGPNLYYSYTIPYQTEGEARPQVQYYFMEIDLTTPAAPHLNTPVNVPGALVAVQGDIIYTQERLWGASNAQYAVNKLVLKDGLAYRQASYVYANDIAIQAALDGAGHLVVSQLFVKDREQCSAALTAELTTELSVLSASDLSLQGRISLDEPASFATAYRGRALYFTAGGLLVINVQEPSKPFGQAFLPITEWASDIQFDLGNFLISAGPCGIYQMDLSTFNLLPPFD
jgi:hypothetical protein